MRFQIRKHVPIRISFAPGWLDRRADYAFQAIGHKYPVACSRLAFVAREGFIQAHRRAPRERLAYALAFRAEDPADPPTQLDFPQRHAAARHGADRGSAEIADTFC